MDAQTQTQILNLYNGLAVTTAERETARYNYTTSWHDQLENSLAGMILVANGAGDSNAQAFLSYFADFVRAVTPMSDMTGTAVVKDTLGHQLYETPGILLATPDNLAGLTSLPEDPGYGVGPYGGTAQPLPQVEYPFLYGWILQLFQSVYSLKTLPAATQSSLAYNILGNAASGGYFRTSFNNVPDFNTTWGNGILLYQQLYTTAQRIVDDQNQINLLLGVPLGTSIGTGTAAPLAAQSAISPTLMSSAPQWSQTTSENVATLTPMQVEAINRTLMQSGLFKAPTNYILIGDEPLAPRGSTFDPAKTGIAFTGDATTGVVDLTVSMTASQISDMLKLLTQMPRIYLQPWFMNAIAPSITVASQLPMMWGAFIDLFNQANLAYVTGNGIMPWAWEQTKLQNWLIANNAAAMATLTAKLASYNPPDPNATPILAAYEALPALSDMGLEINRQNAVNQLLKQKDYQTAQAIVDAFKYFNAYNNSQAQSSATASTVAPV